MMEETEKVYAALRKVRQIELRARILLDEALSGAYHSVFKGRGVNFEEVREYNFGDEIRFIDWNITAKMDHPFVKVFREERELTLLLAVDISRSNEWGSSQQTKREFSAEVASLLAFSAARNNDKVGLLLFSDQVELFIPPRKGRQHLLRIIREILFFKPTHSTTNLQVALEALAKLQKHKAIIGFISDFVPTHDELDLSEMLSKLSLLNQKHDLICINISDEREHSVPNVGYLALQDAETQKIFYVNSNSEQCRRQFAAIAKRRNNALYQACKKRGIDLIRLQSNQAYLPLLKTFFKTRQASRR